MCVPDEEREQVERLRWPSRGYLQELSEYQQRRRKLRKSRCIVMWPQLAASGLRTTGRRGKENISTKSETVHRQEKAKKRFFCLCGWMTDWPRRTVWNSWTNGAASRVDWDIHHCDTPLFPWRTMCVWESVCPLHKDHHTQSWAIQNDWSFKPRMNLKGLLGHWPEALWKIMFLLAEADGF